MMTTTFEIEKAQQEFLLLVKRALAGEDIAIEAKLSPIEPAAKHTVISGTSYRGRGALKGKLLVGPEFFEPLSDEKAR
jgi:hypothetical protein